MSHVIEYKQDTITHLPIIIKKTIKSNGIITTATKDNHISTLASKIDSVDSNRVVTQQATYKKDVTRTNYTVFAIIAGVIIAIVIALKMIIK